MLAASPRLLVTSSESPAAIAASTQQRSWVCKNPSGFGILLENVCELPDISPPTSSDQLIPDTLPATFFESISNKDSNKAFQIWSNHAESILFEIAHKQGHPHKVSNIRRGQVKFHDVRHHPQVLGDQASTMQDRKIWKAICRAIECQKASPGVRRDRTWKAISEVIPHLPNQFAGTLSDLLGKNVSLHTASEVEQILQAAHAYQCSENAKCRIQRWKQRMRHDEYNCSSWIRKRHQPFILQVAATPEGGTANNQRRIQAIRHSWSKIFHTHKNGEPSLHQFMSKFGATLQRSITDLPPIQEHDLISQIHSTKPSCPGIDKWKCSDLQTLAKWCPSMFSHLAVYLNAIEDGLLWPDPLKIGVVAFIPKEVENGLAEPLQHRPITILSVIYRLWSATRHNQLAEVWQPHWIPDTAFGVKNKPAADILAYQTCIDIEKALRQQKHTGGLSFDFEKMF